MPRQYNQGTYKVKNMDKYVGKKHPRYLSSYEYHMFSFLDRSPAVVKWGAEMVVVPYYNEVKKRKARYIVDVYVKYKDKDGNFKEELIEIKPFDQTQPPKRGRKRKDVYMEEMFTYIQNQNKWEAAQKYAEERGWEFRIMTENSLFKS